MKTMQKFVITGALAACAAFDLSAMPTKEETEKAAPIVQKLLASEQAALESGKKTCSEVAAAAMKFAGEADMEAEKLLLMKGAFALYVKDGNLEKAAETMKALKAAIPDLSPVNISNMTETALQGADKSADGARLYQLLDITKKGLPQIDGTGDVDVKAILEAVSKLDNGNEKYRTVVGMLFPGWMVENKDIGDDFGGFRAGHRGVCNVFVTHPPTREKPVVISRTVKLSDKYPCLFLSVSSFKRGCDSLLAVRVDGDEAMPFRTILTFDEDPWEDLVVPLFPWRGSEVKIEIVHKANDWWCENLFFSRIEIAEGTGRERCGLVGVLKEKVNGSTWSYQVKDGTARIVSESYSCAVTPEPVGSLKIPSTLGKVPVSQIGRYAFKGCGSLTSVSFPTSLRHIAQQAFAGCGLTSLTVPEGVESIENDAFSDCVSLKAAILPDSVMTLRQGAFIRCRGLTSVRFPKNLAVLEHATVAHCASLKSVEIPATVTDISTWVFSCCEQLRLIVFHGERPNVGEGAFAGCGNLKEIHVPANAKSWAGMKEWQGFPLVFDGAEATDDVKVDKPTSGENVAAEKLQSCDFLLNKAFKKNAKYYLCLFSASWCGPCRREMPRIAKMYAETLKDDPNIELIHFSRDQNDEKALAWAKEQGVTFPVVKPNGGNPLNLQSRGIPYLFIVKADGTLVESDAPSFVDVCGIIPLT